MVLLYDNEKRRIEKEFNCHIGYSEQGDSVLVLPKQSKMAPVIIKEIHRICKTVMDVTFSEKPLGIKLHGPGEEIDNVTNLSNSVCVSAVSESAKSVGLMHGSFLLRVNGESVVGKSKQQLVKVFQDAQLPVVLTTGACENALDVICFQYEMTPVEHDLFDWVAIKEGSECQIQPRVLDEHCCQILVGGPKEAVVKCVNLIKREAEEVELVDIVGISFILHHADSRILNRLKEECHVLTTDINDLRYAKSTRIAIRATS
eukprot:TRINITY_DN259_c0_g1_i3.p1 TRINITY_DN259_c0_g1~~TRINITY_DN259_c0_g1_i3.p1  ORF type:complete len:294 (+),score=51.74 TRINITY_DN259_c0_g1_i3:108-884(+)